MNLKEAYAMYKETPNTLHIGFSTFASLRPKNCILAGSSGTHSVCVCTYHQNAKLQISALGVKDIDYKLLIAKSVCERENKDCMMHVCPKCDRGGVKKFVRQLETFKKNEEFTYKQWVSTDRCTIVQVIESSENFLESLSNKVNKLTRHHFVAKAQTRFLKHLKSNLQPNEVIILGDFSENYSYIVQDEVQGFHWENSQCTVHPFVAYYRNNSNTELVHASFCFLSPVTKHETSMVHTFLCTLIAKIKEKCQTVQKVHYFTDGCAAQYKNKNNFSNICYHYADFALNCKWHFFATSHGKSACDGIRGTIKRTVAKASLQRVYNNQILSAEDMYKFCIKHFENKIHFFLITNEAIKEKEELVLNKRFSEAVTITGTQKFHKFIPIDNETIKVFELSCDSEGMEIKIVKPQYVRSKKFQMNPQIGNYVVCSYNSDKWVGFILSYDEEFEDFEIKFLQPRAINKFYYFPEIVDKCNISS